jgi:hypothetical protein
VLRRRSVQNRADDLGQLPVALRVLFVDAQRTHGPVRELQPVIQLCSAGDYPGWSADWRAAWSEAGVGDTGVEWPERLPPRHTAGLLVPVPPGRVGDATPRHPAPAGAPLLVHARLPRHVADADFALNLLLGWLETRPPGLGLRLAPPVVETTRSGAVVGREVVDYGQRWALPRPVDL